jgi:mannose-1-phosphate guanylyltransferase
MNLESKNSIPFLVVLMAGGGGTRLWPLSRPDEPKQCLPLLGGRSLFESTVERLQGIVPPENIFVITNNELAPLLRRAVAAIPGENYFCEPAPRNTAPAVAYALARLQARVPRFVMACLPSDHYIENSAEFRGLIRAAVALAEQGYLATLGIEPTEPVTGYGYIEQGESLGTVEGHPAFRVRRFTEKPDLEKAREMLRRGGYTWNSGMFFWRSDVFVEELTRHQPGVARTTARLADAFQRRADSAEVEKIWATMPSLSLDYGILEKSEKVVILPTRRLGWTDIGSWDALIELYRAHPELRSGEAGRHFDAGSQSVTVLRKTESERILATVGLDDVIIVETDDAILICKGGASQDVRKIVDRLPKQD